jgi:hypothetical protein
MRRCIVPLAVLLVGALACHPRTTPARYLYVVTCDARVDKLDTTTDRKIGAYELAQRTGNQTLIPPVVGTLDGCLAYQAVYDPKASIFRTVVPVEVQPKADGTKDYRVLAFSVPDLQWLNTASAGTNLDAPPRVEGETAGPPQTDLDLSAFTPDRTAIPNQILESSAEKVLLRIFTANPSDLMLAVADRRSHTLVRLQSVVPTVAPAVHLAPGGEVVLVEETEAGGSHPAKNGKLSLYDAKTGSRIQEFSDPHIKELYFLTISPTGKAIYHSGETYWFLDLGKTFPVDAVTRVGPGDSPAMFFADR